MCPAKSVARAHLSTITPMGMAPKALRSGACGLCRTFLGAHVPCPDSHSKWIEVHMTNSSTTAVTIAKIGAALQQWAFLNSWLPIMALPSPAKSLRSSKEGIESSTSQQHHATPDQMVWQRGLSRPSRED